MTDNLNRNVYEGWTPQDFIDELQPIFDIVKGNNNMFGENNYFNSKQDLKKWCIDNQPYYKKHIPEVYNHFLKQTNFV